MIEWSSTKVAMLVKFCALHMTAVEETTRRGLGIQAQVSPYWSVMIPNVAREIEEDAAQVVGCIEKRYMHGAAKHMIRSNVVDSPYTVGILVRILPV
jgi:hypothetical protein